ncbi:MAG: replicative DNA helicase [Flavobacteriaceae bacterium]|nr:replicative DNA helicase [Flavobacteriaceae bacterium]
MSFHNNSHRRDITDLNDGSAGWMIEQFGKLPPQAIDLEELVLGAIMLDKEAMETIADMLPAHAFYKESNQKIYEAARELFGKAEPIDIVTVTKQCRENGSLNIVGGAYYITSLTNRVGSAAHIEYHARIISEKYMQRELIRISSEITTASYDDSKDIFELLDFAEKSLFGIAESTIARQTEHILPVMKRTVKQIEAIEESDSGLSGIASGLVALDRLTHGWKDGNLIILAGRPGTGKCLRKGTKVLMYDGTLKNAEDIVKSDLLMGDDSTPRKVLSTISGKGMMYWVRQTKGVDYSVNGAHVLSLMASGTEGSRIHGQVVNISVDDYLKKSRKFQIRHKGYKTAVEFAEKPLFIEPYFIGAWLGDGSKAGPKITKDEHELTTYLEQYAKKLGLQLTSTKAKGKCADHSITKGRQGGDHKKNWSLSAELGRMNLLFNKHIPQDYLINSSENRLQLLAGLLDTDGSITANCFEITQKDYNLAKQIEFLCNSLGLRTSFAPKIGTIKSIGFTGIYYRVFISGNIDIIPTKIARKQGYARKQPKNWQVTGITIEQDRVDDYYGFELDGNHLFLLEDMTVTHNSSAALMWAKSCAQISGKPVAFFSLEMESTELATRLLSAEAQVNSETMNSGKLQTEHWERINRNINIIGNLPIYVDDTPALTMFTLKAKCRRLKAQHSVGMVVIDYLQLMKGDENNRGSSREQEVAYISRSLKAMAKEMSLPIIALAQLNRDVEKRADKRPILSDLRESGSIEQDADIVIFINRPEKNGELMDEAGNSTVGVAEFIVAKHRGGATDTIRARFQGEYTRFVDWEDPGTSYNYGTDTGTPMPPNTGLSPNTVFLPENGDVPF